MVQQKPPTATISGKATIRVAVFTSLMVAFVELCSSLENTLLATSSLVWLAVNKDWQAIIQGILLIKYPMVQDEGWEERRTT